MPVKLGGRGPGHAVRVISTTTTPPPTPTLDFSQASLSANIAAVGA